MALAGVVEEILANLFRAVAEEMSWVVLRAAHTTFVKETQDYAANLVTKEGEVFAYPHKTGVTALLGIPLADGVKAFDDWEPGDIMIANDPYLTRGMVMHLADLYLMKPVFADGRLLCFVWDFIHCSDVGGSVPGSIGPLSHEIFQEGLRLRPVKLYRRGELNQDLWNVIADNCRIPELNWGDISALVAALKRGEERLQRLVRRYGFEQVDRAIYSTLDRTEERARAVLKAIPPGEYRFVDYLDDDYVSDIPVRIEVCLRVRGDGTVEVDLTGSDPQVRSALNLPTGDQRHHPFLCIALLMHIVTRAEGLNLNAGLLRCIDLVLPKASVVNASFPASCGMRYVTAMRVHDAMLGALAKAVPGGFPAAGAGEIAVTLVSTLDPKDGTGRVAVANPVQGGTGGGPSMDGVSGVDYPTSFLRNVPIEVLESEMPVVVHRFGLIPDSEGAGKYRGGFGIRYDLEVRDVNAVVVMRAKERYRFQPWGVRGGRAGTLGGTDLLVAGERRGIGKASIWRPQLGEILSIYGAGGGGYGDPITRDPSLVLKDVADGLVSIERARDVYGVAVANGTVDYDETERVREELRQKRAEGEGDAAQFDFGAAREEWEREFGPASEEISRWVHTVTPALRPYCKEQAYRLLRRGKGPYGVEAARQALRELQRMLGEQGVALHGAAG